MTTFVDYDQDAVTAAMIGFDEAARASEAKWGVGRLVSLVSDATRLSFHRGWEAWHKAQTDRDEYTLLAIIPKMVRALGIMDAEAARLGHAPLDINVWETRAPDGRVLAIVRTAAEASAVVRSGRAMTVYTLEEIGRLLRKIETIDAIKLEFPGARVSRVTQLDEGFADSWATAEPCHEALFGDQTAPVKPRREVPQARPYAVEAA